MTVWVVLGVLIVYLVLAWFTGTWLHLTGAGLWVLRGGLAFLGLVAAGIILWFYYRSRKPAAAGQAASGSDEMDVLVRDAINRLKSSKAGKTALSKLPVIYIMGPAGSTKTTTIVNSGLEPELLAGQVYQDNTVVPTRLLNLWYTRHGIMVEAAGAVMMQPNRWQRLIHRLQASRLSTAMGKGEQAPRAALVCFDCEAFLQAGASEDVPAAARMLNMRLQEVSQRLGINFPVYLLFTKMDRISFFAEYVRNLSREEAAQVLGVTFPLRTMQSGVYAEEETKRFTKGFDDLFYSLAGKRLDFLAREPEQDKLSAIYEFPREIRKLRTLLVQFLVDLGRPSQLQANPFIRGFYFTGVRAITVDDMAQAAVQQAATPEEPGGGATRMLNLAQVRAMAQAPAPARVPAQRKVPQWVFLSHLFNDVILKDRAAMGASGFSTKVSFLRRLLLIGAAIICVILALGFTVSFFGNRALETQVTTAAKAITATEATPGQLPSLDNLKRLETLRQSLETLSTYRREGAPWRLRWGLYVGDSLYPDVQKIYFARFQQLMFGQTQATLLAHLQKLPATPGPNDNYGFAYDTLKAYLITTSNHEKSTKLFLPPVLMNRFLAGRELDPERTAVAQKQFDFYSAELASYNPFSSENDTLAVERARNYLGKFGAVERIYRSMLDEANRKHPSISFHRQFPGADAAVVDSKEVPGAFSKTGYAFMQDAIAHTDRFFAGEEWVLGKQSYGSFDRAALEQELRTRYRNDFLDQWRGFLKAAAVLRYANAADASRKLNLLSGNNSPLLALFWLAATHTAVDNAEIASAFQPVQSVVQPGADRYISGANQPYMNGLVSLQGAMDQVAHSPGGVNDQPAVAQVRTSAMNAMQATRIVEQGFKVDQAGRIDATTAQLMEAPIKNADAILAAMGPAQLNGAGKALCAAFRPVTDKFPFNQQSKTQAGFAEVNALFQPGSGAMWQFYENHLKNLVMRQGSQFVANPSGGVRITPHFLAFFNRAAAFSETVYPGGSPQPRLTYTLRPYPVQGIEALTLDINGQALVAPGTPKQFTWQGGGMSQVRVSGKLGGSEVSFLNYGGTWAVFQFFAEADHWQSAASPYAVEWVPKSGMGGQPMMMNGKSLTLRYDLEMAGAPVFNKAFLQALRCTAEVAH